MADFKVAFEAFLKTSKYCPNSLPGANRVRLAIESLYYHLADVLVTDFKYKESTSYNDVLRYADGFKSNGQPWTNPSEIMNYGHFTLSDIARPFNEMVGEIQGDTKRDKTLLSLVIINQIVQRETVKRNISYHANHKYGVASMRRDGCHSLLTELNNCYSEVITPRCVFSAQFNNLLCMTPFYLPIIEEQFFAVDHLYGILKGALTGDKVVLEIMRNPKCQKDKASFDDMHKISALIKESMREISKNGLVVESRKGDIVPLTPNDCGSLLVALKNANENIHIMIDSHREQLLNELYLEEAIQGVAACTL